MNFIAGIGASAGGLDALEKFFKNMPSSNDISFVVIQHLSPHYKSIMNELLAKYSERNIITAEHGMIIQPGCIYLIPSSKQLTIISKTLYLEDFQIGESVPLPIDTFFHSLAEDMGSKAIAIIFSGTGSDGTKGIYSIKDNGGLVIVQDSITAQFDGMPSSVISTGLADYILKPEQMGEKIIELMETSKSKTGESTLNSADESIQKIFNLIRKSMDLDLTYYKQNTVLRRIERRMCMHQTKKLQEYYLLLIKSPEEIKILCNEMLIGVTHFFRDPEAFNFIKDYVIPEILRQKNNNDNVRIWVPACSTGEEAYTLAILFHEYLLKSNKKHNIKIFATDIDKNAVDTASRGIYASSIAEYIQEELLNRYFVFNGQDFEICKEIREMLVFSQHNLIEDPPFNRIDLISCRNLLIYFQPVLQKKVLKIFNLCLNQNGFLFLGPSETIGELGSYFTQIETRWKIFKHKKPYMIQSDFENDNFINMNFKNVKKYRYQEGKNSKFIENLHTVSESDVAIKDVVKELEIELQYTKENLQATVEELETSKEELQVANEELQSTNEELQAISEELVTLNSEYQSKISELSDDMDIFFSIINISAIFLDENLRVRKFTNVASKIVNLFHLDIGRYLSNISHSSLEVDIVRYAAKVLETLMIIEKEVQNEDGEIYILKFFPYRTRDNVIKGVVITFVNNTI